MEFLVGLYLFFAFLTLYFMFLFLILFFRNRPDKTEKLLDLTYFPSLTILIPVWNEAKTIAETIRAVRNSDYPKSKLKILVVNHGSTDNTRKILKKLKVPFIDYLENVGRGKAYAANYGLKHIKTELVAMLDADCYPERSAFSKVVQYFKFKDVAAVTASVLLKEAKNFIQRLQELEYIFIVWVRKLLEYIDSIYVTPGGLSIYRTKILKKVGAFDIHNMTEDIEIAWRLLDNKYKIKMCLGARSYVTVPDTLKKWWRQRLRWDIGGIQTWLKYRSAFFNPKKGMLGWFVAPFFFSSMLLSLLGFFVFLGLFIKRAYTQILFWLYSSSVHINPLSTYEFIISNLYVIFGLLIFGISLFYVYIGAKVYQKNPFSGIRNFFELLVYLTVYLMAFPILMLQSIFLFLTQKEYKWR